MYILKEDIKDVDGLVRWLEEHMFVRSGYSCKKRNMRAIAIHLSEAHDANQYIFCSELMCDPDPYISWLNCRKRYLTEDEFTAALKEKIARKFCNKV